jgi:hypothetical protein
LQVRFQSPMHAKRLEKRNLKTQFKNAQCKRTF